MLTMSQSILYLFKGIQIIIDVKTTSFGDDVHEHLLVAKRQEESFRHRRRLKTGGFCEAWKCKRAGKKASENKFQKSGINHAR
jgi:hypothetical protein